MYLGTRRQRPRDRLKKKTKICRSYAFKNPAAARRDRIKLPSPSKKKKKKKRKKTEDTKIKPTKKLI